MTDSDLILSYDRDRDGDGASYCIDLPGGLGTVCLGPAEHRGGGDFKPSQAALAKLTRIKRAIAGACADGQCGCSAPEQAEPGQIRQLLTAAMTLAKNEARFARRIGELLSD